VKIWDLVQRLSGQMRVAGLAGAITGLDMLAAFRMADALGVCEIALAEFLPGIEAEMVRGMNKQMRESNDDGA
jgi:predicted dinucleotide-utilizing enzyme